MKQVSQQIIDQLNQNNIISEIENLAKTHGDNLYGDVNLKEAFNSFMNIKDFLMETAENGKLDETPYTRRVGILNSLKSILNHRRNLAQIIIGVEELKDHLNSSGLYVLNLGHSELQNELKNISKLKRSITEFKNNYENTKKNLDFISRKKQEFLDLINDIETEKNDINSAKETTDNLLSETVSNSNQVVENLDQIIETIKDVEVKKLSIDTFADNIEEYKKIIEQIESRAKAVIEQDEKIKKLIESAQEALQINSAYGISSAFSAQYESSNNKKIYSSWIWGAVALLLLAVGLTVWAIGGWGIADKNSLNSILGRIVAVGLSVTGAAFCAKQYVRQKNIAEDYAYKAVLSKSIVAFADEISGSDDDNNSYVGKYLEQVLSEIHKDPLRSRKDIDDSGFLSKRNVDKVATIIKAAKGE